MKLFLIRFLISYCIIGFLSWMQCIYFNNIYWSYVMFWFFLPANIGLSFLFHFFHDKIPKFILIIALIALVFFFFYHIYIKQEEVYTIPILSQLLIPKFLRRKEIE